MDQREERRRGPRVDVDLPVRLGLFSEKTGKMMVGPLFGRLVDISVYGCRLHLTIQSRDDLYLLDWQDEGEACRLQLEIIMRTASGRPFAVSIVPIWFKQPPDKESIVVMGAEFDACSASPDYLRGILAGIIPDFPSDESNSGG